MNISKIAKDHETAWIGEAELATRAPSAPLEADASWNHLEEVESAHSTKLFCPQVQHGATTNGTRQVQAETEYYRILFFVFFVHPMDICVVYVTCS